MENKEEFENIVNKAKKDPNILGFYLSGSRGKGKETKYSDYDIEIVVKDDVKKEYEKKYSEKQKALRGISFCIYSISEFRTYANIGTEYEWDRPSFTYIKTIIDKTGEIQKLIDEKGIIPKENIKKYVSGFLDGYINYVYRSLKCFRDGNIVGARLEASRSLNFFLIIVFGMEGRLAPYYKYLEWELKEYPLNKFKMPPKEIIKYLMKILESGDIKTQQRLFIEVEKIFRKEGYSHIFDGWEKDQIEFMKTFKIKR
jgi:hypothetical protein